MAKAWGQLTQAEKIEELRSDIEKLMGAVSGLSQARDHAASHISQLNRQVGEMATALKLLEMCVPTPVKRR